MSKKVMTVDDSATVRKMLRLTLEDAGYEVAEAQDGREALQRIAKERIDLLITDLNMPELDGLDLIRELRRDPANRFLPIIMLTTESQAEKKREGKEAGASGWLVKPFKPEQVLAVIRMVLP